LSSGYSSRGRTRGPGFDTPGAFFVADMIYTVGHSNHPIERFLALLQGHGVEVLADVRSMPYSRFNPQFKRDALAGALARNDIEYLFLGQELGARSKDRACYDDAGRVSYRKLAETEFFRRGIERLLTTSRSRTTAIMCAEKDPLDCHRTILVARALEARGESILHILASSEIETHAEAMARLRAKLNLTEDDLFGGDLNEQAYDIRAREIAYVDPKLVRP
jgi:uncharacterized protein (DUF488 family)